MTTLSGAGVSGERGQGRATDVRQDRPTFDRAPRRPAAAGTTCSRAARATGCVTTTRCATPCASTCRDRRRRGRAEPRADSTVRVPVRMLEHYRFRLRDSDDQQGVGQGDGKARRPHRDRPATGTGQRRGRAATTTAVSSTCSSSRSTTSSTGSGRRCSCRTSKAKPGAPRDDDWTREGWDRRGARSRLDRRRSLKEAIKRRAVQTQDSPTFTDDDLRYRQLAQARAAGHRRPSCSSRSTSRRAWASATASSRRRSSSGWCRACAASTGTSSRCSSRTPPRRGSSRRRSSSRSAARGGTVASTALTQVREIIDAALQPGQFNIYLFYASDGENFPSDQRSRAGRARGARSAICNYIGFLEVGVRSRSSRCRQRDRRAVRSSSLRRRQPTSRAYALSAAGRHLGRRARTSSASSRPTSRATHERRLAKLRLPGIEAARARARASTTTRSSSRWCREAS